MLSVKEKLAALRAKRVAQKSAPPATTSDALSAAVLALGEPQVSWDEDYKEKLEEQDFSHDVKQPAVSSCSTDNDDDELVVLPPPTRKLNPAAQRQLWRMREIERARLKAAKNLMESRPASFDVDEIPTEQCSEDPNAVDEREEDEERRGDGGEDEGEAALHRQESEGFADNDALEEDEEEAALESAQRIEEEEMEDEQDELPLGPAQNAPKETDQSLRDRSSIDAPPRNEPLSSAGFDHSVSRDGQGPGERHDTRAEENAKTSDEAFQTAGSPSPFRELVADKTNVASSDPNESRRLDNKVENDNTSEAGEGVPEENDYADVDQAKSSSYVEAMFLQDDSRSKYLEDENEETDENDEDNSNRREKARALWKTRQKTKTSLFQEDENSLSRFDIFGDTDESRSAHFRMKLESACRPVLQKGVGERSRIDRDHRSSGMKRNTPWSSERSVPEWEKRNACFQQKQRKRQRSVSVGKWSFAAHGEKEKVPSKASKIGPSGVGYASLGSTYLARKSRSRASALKRKQPSSAQSTKTPKRSSSEGPTSFKGLLSILGNRAETDL